jgi:hypothetical protein
MDLENKYASRGVGGTALGLAIGSLGLQTLNGGLGGILGCGAKTNTAPDSAIWNAALMGAMSKSTCNEDHLINRYEMALIQELAAKDGKIANLESTIYTDSKIADVYERLNAKIGEIEAQIGAQAVFNATLNGTRMHTGSGRTTRRLDKDDYTYLKHLSARDATV